MDANHHVQLQVMVAATMTFKDPPYKTASPQSTTTDWAFWADEQIVVAQLLAGQPEKYTMKIKAEPTEFRRKTFDADY